jgi:hypothetical protein
MYLLKMASVPISLATMVTFKNRGQVLGKVVFSL